MTLPPYSGALASALLWAVSAQVVSAGSARVPAADRMPVLMTGLLVSQCTGLAGLAALLWWQQGAVSLHPSLQVWLAGVLTFPVGTGLYYVAGALFGGRSDIASQFAKVKPLLSLLLAVAVLGEPVAALFSVSSLLVALGVLVFVAAGLRGAITLAALGWGLSAALAWSLGEVLMGAALAAGPHTAGDALRATYTALLAGAVVSVPFLLPFAVRWARSVAGRASAVGSLWPYTVHGVLSFALGYFCFFQSMAQVGMASTVTVNAMWPILALVLACGWRRWRGQPCEVAGLVWLAATLLLLGSLWHAQEMAGG